MFFQGRDEVHKTMRRLANRLEKAGIPYVVVGGMAVYAHHYRRTTNDVDFLVTADGFDEFQRLFVPKNYEPMPKRPRRFIDRVNKVTVDFLVTGHFPGSGKPGPISYPDPTEVGQTIEKIQVANLTSLIQLKLANCTLPSTAISSNAWKKNAARMNTKLRSEDEKVYLSDNAAGNFALASKDRGGPIEIAP